MCKMGLERGILSRQKEGLGWQAVKLTVILHLRLRERWCDLSWSSGSWWWEWEDPGACIGEMVRNLWAPRRIVKSEKSERSQSSPGHLEPTGSSCCMARWVKGRWGRKALGSHAWWVMIPLRELRPSKEVHVQGKVIHSILDDCIRSKKNIQMEIFYWWLYIKDKIKLNRDSIKTQEWNMLDKFEIQKHVL